MAILFHRAEQIVQFCRGHFCEIILNLGMFLSFKDICILSSVGHFVQKSNLVCAIFVEGIMMNISVTFIEFGPVLKEEMSFKEISNFRYSDSLVRGSRTICAISVDCINHENFLTELRALRGYFGPPMRPKK